MDIENDWNSQEINEEDVGNYGDDDLNEDTLDLDDMGNGGVAPAQQQDGVVLMRFCPHDSSMLYPKVGQRCFRLRLEYFLSHFGFPYFPSNYLVG